VRTLYFDCFSGAAGDMLLGALLDAGASAGDVDAAIASLGIPGVTLQVRDVRRGALRATKVDVVAPESAERRGPREIEAILRAGPLPDEVRELALRTFDLLAKAEAAVHGISPEEVHFHEVGAVDAIVDVVACAAALRSLRVERVVVSALPSGSGTAETEHGPVPVPAPAVLELLKGAPIEGRGEHELVTPTGAALLRAVANEFGPIPPMTVWATGYGAGSRDTDVPNVVRVLVGEATGTGAGRLMEISANLDDMSPELLPHALEQLLAAGAADAWITPVIMKKGRPGFVLSALAGAADADRVVDVFLRETTTFGVRMHEVEREVLERSWTEVEVEGHPVRVKVGRRGHAIVSAAPEHDDARRVAKATGMPLKQVYELALRAAGTRL
jgi:uncharacterized protein (TIGR00299 family) protein